jgi:hypothetical protein
MRGARQHKLAFLLMIGVLLLIIPIQDMIHKGRPGLFDPDKPARSGTISIGPTPAVIASLGGFRTMAADLLWLKAEHVWHTGSWWAMLPILEGVTQLDPRFIAAWKVYGWHAAYNLHAESETMADRRYWLEQGEKILERGVLANPDTYEMYFELAWTLYDRSHKKRRAAEYFRKAAEFPDAPHTVTRLIYKSYEGVLDFENLFPALREAVEKHKDNSLHQRLATRDLEFWESNWQNPDAHRKEIVTENTQRLQRSVAFELYEGNPFWDVCPACGLPSPKGSDACEVCNRPFPQSSGEQPAEETPEPVA